MASPDEPRLKRIEDKLDRIEYSIVGNGQPGLNERVRSLERNEEKRARDAVIFQRTAYAGLVAVALAVGGFLLKLFGMFG